MYTAMCRRHAIPFVELVRAFLLSRELKQCSRLKQVLTRAIQYALPPAVAQGVLRDEVWNTVPERWTLSRGNLHCDAAFMMLQRKLFHESLRAGGCRRFLKLDSSPQGGRDWLVTESSTARVSDLLALADAASDLLQHEEGSEAQADAAVRLETQVESHIFPPMAMASKRTDLVSKFHAFSQVS